MSWRISASCAEHQARKQDVKIGSPIELVNATAQHRLPLFSFKSTRGHDAASISGTFGSADEQAKLQCFKNIRDIEQETGGSAAHSWYGALSLRIIEWVRWLICAPDGKQVSIEGRPGKL